MKQKSISVVIPVFNSKSSLPELLDRLHLVLNKIGEAYEVILVNDGSRDESWETVARLIRERKNVCGIDLMRNFGQHNALLCGIRAARHQIVVTMDDDLQHPPEEIPTLLAELTDDIDVVYGTPKTEQHGLWRDVASRMTKRALQGSLGATIAGQISAFRAFRTQLRDAFASYRGPHVSIDVLLSWGTTRFRAVKVAHQPRRLGTSNYTVRKLIIHAVNLMTGFSTRPLQVASLLGFSFTMVGLLALVHVIARYILQGDSVPGFPFLASMIAVFGGVQLFCLGIMGEYLARMYSRLLDRPTYAIRQQGCAEREEV